MNNKPIGAGKSSFDLIDSTLFFETLPLDREVTFLDIACGQGNYSLAASKVLGNNSIIFAIDLWEEGIFSLLTAISERKIKNIWATVADVSQRIPMNKNSVDICLMATVLHDLVKVKAEHGTLKEISRVLKPAGMLVIVEFKKMEGPPGPPIDIRLSVEEVERIVTPYGLVKKQVANIGPYTYLARFIL